MRKSLFLLVSGLTLASFLLGADNAVYAAKLYKWVDENGNVSYQDTPPPEDVEFEEKAIRGGDTGGDYNESMQAAAETAPITLYRVETCDSCDLIDLHLKRNNVPFTEKNAAEDIVVQEELKAKSGGLQVPTLTIGDEVITGYSKSSIDNALVAAGYPIGSEQNQERADGEDQTDQIAEDEATGDEVEIDFSAIDEDESSAQ